MSRRLKSNDPADIEDWVIAELDERREAAFVEGDAVSHRLAHASMIKSSDDNHDLKRTLIKNSVWGFSLAVLTINFDAMKAAVKLWFKS